MRQILFEYRWMLSAKIDFRFGHKKSYTRRLP